MGMDERTERSPGAGAGPLVNLDKLTCAGNPANLDSVAADPAYMFVHEDICDAELVSELLRRHRPRAVVHFAAERHADRSILGPEAFLRTNIDGTFSLLRAAREFYESLKGEERERFRFLHVSTDEVYGTLTPEAPAFHEETPYAPNSPYAASKAASDHLVRAWVAGVGMLSVRLSARGRVRGEGDYSCGRVGNEVVSGDADGVEATAAGV